MSHVLQKMAIRLLERANEIGDLDPSVESRMAYIINSGTRPKVEQTLKEGESHTIGEIVELATRPLGVQELKKGGIISAETAELMEKLGLEAQYGERLKTLIHYGFLTKKGEVKNDEVKQPTFEATLRTFQPEELVIASHFQKPTLLLIPETPFARKVEALDKCNHGKYEKTHVDVEYDYTDTDLDSDKISGWRVCIVDGAIEIKPYDNVEIYSSFSSQVINRKMDRGPLEKGMNRNKFILLLMEILKSYDLSENKRMATLLDDDPALSPRCLPHVIYNPVNCRIDFLTGGPNLHGAVYRLRSSIGGDVLLK